MLTAYRITDSLLNLLNQLPALPLSARKTNKRESPCANGDHYDILEDKIKIKSARCGRS
jgi:hypothetical protein